MNVPPPAVIDLVTATFAACRELQKTVWLGERSGRRLAHLKGLNFSRALCWNNLAASLPATDSCRAIIRDAAARHLAANLPHVAGDYMGEHWLATFALLASDVAAAFNAGRETSAG